METISFVLNHWGKLLSASVMLLSGIGMIHQVVLLGAFGVDFFDFAEIEDFLLAAGTAFKSMVDFLDSNTLVFFLATATTVIVGSLTSYWTFGKVTKRQDQKIAAMEATLKSSTGVTALEQELEKELFHLKDRRFKRTVAGTAFTHTIVMFLIMLITSTVYQVSIVASSTAAGIRSGEMQQVGVELLSLNGMSELETLDTQFYYISAAGSHIFLYQKCIEVENSQCSGMNRTHVFPANWLRLDWESQ